ncbi:MAG: hypothetical protein HC893_00600 [Chloroflexaceae bacterium]|nr:hypothetical protein [Chloroflexaceae bacterium]NJL32619.1 hypothetical protein [Chloroflexaceae bacterium]NJO04729.1 hypothetical protein [Chloroflexaceae bacterium]
MQSAHLEEALLAVAAAIWKESTEPIRSELIYQQLCASGEAIPEGAMNAVFRSLQRDGVLGGTLLINEEAQRTHGGFVITWLDPSYLT